MWHNPVMDCLRGYMNFYSHIPCGMWHFIQNGQKAGLLISTHTSRVGCDCILCVQNAYLAIFLLTHPVWDVTNFYKIAYSWIKFLLTHPVWDVTLFAAVSSVGGDVFLLTHPVWDVTITSKTDKNRINISTHTSRVGCDLLRKFDCMTVWISTHTSRVGCDASCSLR